MRLVGVLKITFPAMQAHAWQRAPAWSEGAVGTSKQWGQHLVLKMLDLSNKNGAVMVIKNIYIYLYTANQSYWDFFLCGYGICLSCTWNI